MFPFVRKIIIPPMSFEKAPSSMSLVKSPLKVCNRLHRGIPSRLLGFHRSNNKADGTHEASTLRSANDYSSGKEKANKSTTPSIKIPWKKANLLCIGGPRALVRLHSPFTSHGIVGELSAERMAASFSPIIADSSICF